MENYCFDSWEEGLEISPCDSFALQNQNFNAAEMVENKELDTALAVRLDYDTHPMPDSSKTLIFNHSVLNYMLKRS